MSVTPPSPQADQTNQSDESKRDPREDGQLSDSQLDSVSGGATLSSTPPKLGPAGVPILPNEGGN